MHTGTVCEWFPEGGWGVLDCVDTPGGCWAHFSAVVMIGYREIIAGDSINFTFESGPQDGYDFRAVQVWPPGVDPGTSEPSPAAPSNAYRSSLTITFDDGKVVHGEQAHELIRRAGRGEESDR